MDTDRENAVTGLDTPETGAAEDVMYGDTGLLHGLANQFCLEAADHGERTVPGEPIRSPSPARYAGRHVKVLPLIPGSGFSGVNMSSVHWSGTY